MSGRSYVSVRTRSVAAFMSPVISREWSSTARTGRGTSLSGYTKAPAGHNDIDPGGLLHPAHRHPVPLRQGEDLPLERPLIAALRQAGQQELAHLHPGPGPEAVMWLLLAYTLLGICALSRERRRKYAFALCALAVSLAAVRGEASAKKPK